MLGPTAKTNSCREHWDMVFSLLQEYWTPNNPMQNTIILLIEQIVVALGGEFKLYLPQLIPHMLRVFMHDNSPGRSVTIKVNAYTVMSVKVAMLLTRFGE